MKRIDFLSNTKGVTLFEILISIGLLGIAVFFAANLVIDMSTQNKKLDIQNSVVSIKTMIEGIVNNNILCTSNLKDIAIDINMPSDIVITTPLYSDPGKTKIFLQVNKKPNLNVVNSIKVKSIMLKSVKYIIDTSAMPVGPNIKIASGGGYFFKANYSVEVQNDDKKSIYSEISVPIVFEVDPSTGKIIKCSGEIATVVKYSKNSTAGSLTSNCSDITPTGSSALFASRILSASAYCQCSCVDALGVPTCPGGTYREGGIQKVIEPNTYQIVCSDPPNCSAHIDLFCKVNIGK